MKKIHYSQLESIGTSMESFKKQFNIEEGMKRATLYKFWHKVVGPKFKDFSKPVSINTEGVLMVACKNSFVTNELYMFKDGVLEKLKPYLTSLKIKVSDIVFSHKIWREEETEATEVDFTDNLPQKPTEEELDRIEIDEETLLEIKLAIEKTTFASEEQKEKMIAAIVKNLKQQRFYAKLIYPTS